MILRRGGGHLYTATDDPEEGEGGASVYTACLIPRRERGGHLHTATDDP